jgi:hypothetical protein
MGWINTFHAFFASGVVSVAASADACEENVVNGAPYGDLRVTESLAVHAVASPEVPIPEEIRRRQIALAVRYVTMARAR